MPANLALLLAVGLFPGDAVPARPAGPDLAHLQEMLQDRQHPLGQSQAALLLLQCPGEEAERVVRGGLQQFEEPDVFLALASAVRACQDGRFTEELLAALSVNRPGVRRAAAEALAVLPDAELVRRLRAVAIDERAEPGARQAALWALGRCGRKQAVAALLEGLGAGPEPVRKAAAEALTDLTGQPYGLDAARWREWWDRQKDLSEARWLESRLSYQASRANRLEGDVEQLRAHVLRLHQQLYSRLPVSERLAYLQGAAEQEDAAVRGLAVSWAVELLPTADPALQKMLGGLLLRLSHDGALEVQRAAVLGLGLVADSAAYERLVALLGRGRPPVRAAAARSLAGMARGTTPEALERQRKVVPLLQRALGDPALEVVVEAAEDLGTLGAQEAGPVLTGLLRHPSEPVRQAAAQALERVAEPGVLDGVLQGLDDPSVTVRFSLVGALARVAASGGGLPDEPRKRLLTRLEAALLTDADPGVRSRAATVLGECAGPALAPVLWKCVRAGEDARVQEKAWAALVEIVARAGDLALLQEWDRRLTEARLAPRRLQLLTEVVARWQKQTEAKVPVAAAQETLIQAQLDQGKWTAALPHLREALARPGTEDEVNRRLRWLLAAGEQALQEGNRPEALRAVQDAQPFLPKSGDLAGAFDKLARRASGKQ